MYEGAYEEADRQRRDDLHFEPPYTPEAELHDELQERIDLLSSGCDGLFLILDTAKHNGRRPSEKKIKEHIRECAECFEVNSDFLDD
ncbi:hypothetical protein [Streptomyces atratus]|uniref:hypothetical protein n=1 Tax=Streptomyces atratus TaxID=1893 RepID=UPI00364EB359